MTNHFWHVYKYPWRKLSSSHRFDRLINHSRLTSLRAAITSCLAAEEILSDIYIKKRKSTLTISRNFSISIQNCIFVCYVGSCGLGLKLSLKFHSKVLNISTSQKVLFWFSWARFCVFSNLERELGIWSLWPINFFFDVTNYFHFSLIWPVQWFMQ